LALPLLPPAGALRTIRMGWCHPGVHRPTRVEQTNARGASAGCFLLRPSGGGAPGVGPLQAHAGRWPSGWHTGIVRRAAGAGVDPRCRRNPFAGCSVCARSSTALETATPHPRSQALDGRSEQIVVIESPYEGTCVPRSVPGLCFRPKCRRTLHGHRPASVTRSSAEATLWTDPYLDSERSLDPPPPGGGSSRRRQQRTGAAAGVALCQPGIAIGQDDLATSVDRGTHPPL